MGHCLFNITFIVLLLWLVRSGFAVPVLRSTSAGEIQGYTDHVVADGVTKDITRFLGIPFAEPPTGPNRFQKPVPKARFNSVFNASDGSIACIQSMEGLKKYFPNILINFTEDCLILNIYVPSNFSDGPPASSLSTMVWIYGGGFSAGTAAQFNPDVLSVTTNTIVVTLNYRIGLFGFLQSKDGRFKGNQGLWDQQLALKWVNQNIGMFYGSPSKVTLFGQSAGGASVLYQAMYPGNKGLFQRVISQSGSPLAIWALKEKPNAEEYFNRVGCMTSDPLACLSLKTYQELEVPSTYEFSPAVDRDFLSESPEQILFGNNAVSQAAREFYHSLDILAGFNQDDGAIYIIFYELPIYIKGVNVSDPHITRDQLKNELFSNEMNKRFSNFSKLDMSTKRLLLNLLELEYIDWSDPDAYNTTRMAAVNFGNDMTFFYATIRSLQSHVAQNSHHSSTYFYEYSPKPSSTPIITPPDYISGANHGDELGIVFGAPLRVKPPKAFTEEEKQMSRIIMAFWSNFAKTGNPNKPFDVTMLANTTWPEYDMTSQKYLEFSNQMSAKSVKSHFYAMRMRLWTEIIPSILNSHGHTTTTTITTTPKPLHVDFSGIIG